MKSKVNSSLAAGLVVSIGIFGVIETLGAAPDGPQRLRGMEGRTFEVQVSNLTTGEPDFKNCYTFEEGGVWIDPLFLVGNVVPGTWVQHSNGARTPYTAEATADAVPGIVIVDLVQEGMVTPARGKGVLQLEANTTVDIILTLPGEDPMVLETQELVSVGFQNNDCTLD